MNADESGFPISLDSDVHLACTHERLPVTDWNRCERCGICADACFADARSRSAAR